MNNDQGWRQIELEYRQLRQDHLDQHNKVLHQHILQTWERDSPKMWANLQQSPGRANSLAWVLQDRMWKRQEELMSAGLPVTDAREQAEAENLMLEPEQGDRFDPPKGENEYDRLARLLKE